MTAYFTDPDGRALDTFLAEIDRTARPEDTPNAAEIVANVPIYDGAVMRGMLGGGGRGMILAEWGQVLLSGAGVLAIRGGVADLAALDAVTAVFEQIIAREKAEAGGGGDHFAASGANDRIWNAHQKLCLTAPETYATYAANPVIAAVAEAWLGPAFQVTAQVNLVRPGGAAQEAHRDYHLGFQTAEIASEFPPHVHALTAALTLQGAVAHSDMPVESGPTKLLPFSQSFAAGYVTFRQPDFRAVFEDRYVQLPLRKGDLLFFNPALYHAAGENRTSDMQRMANLLQISSGFGRAMEALDRDAMCRAIYPYLARYSGSEQAALIAATAEAYPFPTNLDSDPPIGGLAPATQADILRQAAREAWGAEKLDAALDSLAARRQA
ncbi:MAG: phytanoyl-CoA dioxygenase family protein [Pseudomonadota bacterium]